MRVTIVAANSLEYDSRLRRTATALAEDGHDVTLVGWRRDELPERDQAGRIALRRVPLDLRLSSAFRPLPVLLRRGLCALIGLDPETTSLAAVPARGADRLRAPVRRLVEIVAIVRRTGPWVEAVVQAVPDTDVFHAKALIALPVIRRAARQTGGRFVYDIADIHVEAARLALLPKPLRRLVASREARWMRDAAGLTAVSEAVADEIVRRHGLPRPVVLLNTPPPYRPEDPSPPPDTGRLRAAADLPPDRPIVLYQGGLSIDRGIEELIAALDVPPLRDRDVTVVAVGYGRLEPLLREEAARRPGRFVLLGPVPTVELLEYTTGAAVSYVGQPPRTLNHRLNLANKLFESIMVGVPVVVSQGTQHHTLVEREGLGRVADIDDPASIGRAVAALLDEPPVERHARRERLRRLALERYSWDVARAGVVGLYRALAGAAKREARDGAAGRHVALLLNNPFTSDSRSWKLATGLAARGYRVTVVARSEDGLPARAAGDGFEVVRIEQPHALGWLPAPGLPTGSVRRRPFRDQLRESVGRGAQAARFLLLARRWADAIAAVVPDADVWQSEGLITLPVALRLRERRGGSVVYDSRDLHVESARFARLPGPWRRLLAMRERRWARASDAVITVSTPYADVLERSLGLRPTIVWNGPRAWDPPDPSERVLHARLGLADSTRVVLHLGALQAHRGVEQLIDAIGLVEQAVLVIVGDGPLRADLEARVRAAPHRDRVHLLGPAAPDQIPALNAAAEVAAMPIHGSTLNHRLTTPTKLFDAIGAGTPVVASDLPGMASVVRETGCGVLCDPTSAVDIARAIRAILDAPPERRAALRAACLAAARGAYAWDRQLDRLIDVYDGLPARTGP